MKLPWADALRLLRKRQEIAQEIREPLLGDSVQAFMAWRAFLIVARGTYPGVREKAQCQEMLRLALRDYPESQGPASALLKGLVVLSKQIPSTIAPWYTDDDSTEEACRDALEKAQRRFRSYRAMEGIDEDNLDRLATDLGSDVYAIRSAVIAHASVTTSGNLFMAIVPAFTSLVAVCACAGIASRAAVPLAQVMKEAAALQ